MAETITRTVEYQGKQYTLEHDANMTDAQVMAAVVRKNMAERAARNAVTAKRNEDAQANGLRPETVPRDMTAGEAARLGLTDFAANFLPDYFLYSPDDIKQQYALSQSGNLTYEGVRQLEERRLRNLANVPEDAQQSTIDSIVRGLSDPMSIAGPANAASTLLRKGAAAATNVALGVTPTAIGVISGEVTRQALPEDMDAWLKDIISVAVGGVSTSVGTALSTAPLRAIGNIASDAKNGSAALPEVVARTNLDAKIKSIRDSGDIDVQLKAMADIEADTGVKLPPLALARDNPIVAEMIKNISSADPTFRSKVKAETEAMLKQLEEGFSRSGVKLDNADEAAVRRTINRYSQRRQEAIEQKQQRQMDKLEEKRVKLSVKFEDTDAAAVGRAIDGIAQAQEAAARKMVSSLYTQAIAEASARGTQVPPNIVRDVYNQVSALKIKDIFVDQPSVANKINTLWAPEDTKAPSILGPTGKPIRMQEPTFKPVSLKELDSLKRATNDKLRKTPRESIQYNKVRALKNIVEDAIDKMRIVDEGFVEQYRRADESFYTQISVPTRAAGMASLTRAQFETATADRLVRTSEQARDFIRFVGEQEGLPIVRHAMRLKARNETFTDGVLDTRKLQNFLNKPSNIELIKLAKMEKEFADTSSGLKTIEESKRRHIQRNNAEMKAVTDGFFKAVFDVDVRKAVKDMLTKAGARDRYLKQIEALPKREREMARKGIEQAFKELALSSNTSAIKFIEDNSKALRQIYGADYIDAVRKMSTMVDIIRGISDNVSSGLGRVQNTDILEQRFGLTLGEISGTMRNQVLSTQRKAINLFTKSLDRKAAGARDKLATEFLLDRDAVARLSQETDGLRALFGKGKLTLKAIGKRYAEAFAEIIPFSLYKTYFGEEAVKAADALEEFDEGR